MCFGTEWRAAFGTLNHPLQDQATDQTRWGVVLVCLRTVNVPVVYFVVHDDPPPPPPSMPSQTLSGLLVCGAEGPPWRVAAQMLAESSRAQWRACPNPQSGEGDLGRDPDRRTTGRFCALRLNVWASCCQENDSISCWRCSDLKREPVLSTGTICPTCGGVWMKPVRPWLSNQRDLKINSIDLISWLDNQKNSN